MNNINNINDKLSVPETLPTLTPSGYKHYSQARLRSEIDEQLLETINVFGYQIPYAPLFITSLGLLGWLLLWRYTELWKLLQSSDYTYRLIFIAFIVFSIIQTAMLPRTSGGTIFEHNQLAFIDQNLQVLISVLIVFLLFTRQLGLEKRDFLLIQKICIIAIVILLIGSLWIEYPIGAQSFSIHTRIKAQIWNIAIALFSICLLIIDDHKMKL